MEPLVRGRATRPPSTVSNRIQAGGGVVIRSLYDPANAPGTWRVPVCGTTPGYGVYANLACIGNALDTFHQTLGFDTFYQTLG